MLKYSLRSLFAACGIFCVVAAIFAHLMSPPREALEAYELLKKLPTRCPEKTLVEAMQNRFPEPPAASVYYLDIRPFTHNWKLPCGYEVEAWYSHAGDNEVISCCIRDRKGFLWRQIEFDCEPVPDLSLRRMAE